MLAWPVATFAQLSYTISNNAVTITGYSGTPTAVTIPGTITNILDQAFEDCTNLTAVTIPSSVTAIGHEVFFACQSLTNIVLPASMTSIGEAAFFDCASLTSLAIPNSVTNLGADVCYDCTGLAKVTLGSGLAGGDEPDLVRRQGEFQRPAAVQPPGDFLPLPRALSLNWPRPQP
jgi:hypothetical protein